MFIALAAFTALYICMTRKEDFFYYFILVSTQRWLILYGAMIIAGAAGIILSVLVARWLTLRDLFPDFIVRIGQYTLSIYLMQGLLCKIADLNSFERGPWWLYLAIAVVVFLCLGYCSLLCAKNKYTSKFLLGK